MKIHRIAIALALAGAAATAQAGDTSRLDTVSVQAGFEAPRALANDEQAFAYPEVALHARAEGSVELLASIGADSSRRRIRSRAASRVAPARSLARSPLFKRL